MIDPVQSSLCFLHISPNLFLLLCVVEVEEECVFDAAFCDAESGICGHLNAAEVSGGETELAEGRSAVSGWVISEDSTVEEEFERSTRRRWFGLARNFASVSDGDSKRRLGVQQAHFVLCNATLLHEGGNASRVQLELRT